MWQYVVVAVLVLVSAAYAAWALLPRGTRSALLARMARLLSAGPPPVARLGASLAERAGGLPAAGGCSACPQSRVEAAGPRRRSSPP